MPIITKPADAIRELVHLRTLRGKVFDLGGDRQRVIQKIGRVHYVDEDGSLQDIELETEIDSAGNITAHKSLPYEIIVHRNGVGFDYRSKIDGGSISLRLDRIGEREFDRSREYSVNRQGRRITFTDLDDGLDIVFELTRFGVRTYRIVKHEAAARSWRWEIECDAVSEAKIHKSRIEGVDANDYSLNVVAKIGTATLLGNGRRRYFSEENWTGQVARLDLTTRIKSWVADVAYPVLIDPDITENIGADADDGYELQAVSWGSAVTRDDFGKYSVYRHPGWRFQTVAVSPGATITLANLLINARSSTQSGGGGKFYGYDTDSAAALSSSIKPSTMAKTTASTTISQSTSTGVRTYDVTTAVAEIVARGGWSSGNNMTIFGLGTTGAYNRTRFEDYSDGGTDEAQLEITLAGGGGGSNHNSLLTLGVG